MRRFTAAVCAMAASCAFRAGDICANDACLTNAAPVARIRGVDEQGNLQVGARTTLLLSAADSADPELDPLTYAWTVSTSCATSVVGATDEVELRLSNLVAGGECGVTLTVSDGANEGTASARLVIRDVGAHVSSTPPCVTDYDAASNAPQGTPEQPFCGVRAALLAAADYQLAEVSIASGTPHVIAGDLLIERGLTIRGGYTRGGSVWVAPLDAARTELALAPPPGATVDPTVRVAAPSPSEEVLLANLAIYRVTPCLGECALIDATATSLTIDHVDLGFGPTVDPANVGANDAFYYSVRVRGGDAATRPIFSMNASTIRGAVTGLASVGVLLTEGIDAVISATTVEEDGHAVTGVRLLGAGDVRVQGSTITATSDAQTLDEARSATSLAFGIADGNASALDIGGCTPASGATCGASKSLTIVATAISADKARLAVGVAALGTREVAFLAPTLAQRSTLAVSGRQAYGLFTMNLGDEAAGVAGMRVEGVTIDVAVLTSGGLPPSVAAGWSDGYEVGAPDLTNVTVGLGSYGALLENAVITIKVGSYFVAEAAGIALRASRDARVENAMIVVVPDAGPRPVNGWSVGRLTGIRLMRTANVALEGGSVSITDLAATWVAGGLIDGQMTLANDAIATGPDGADHGSAELRVHGTTFAGELSVNNIGEVPLRACLGLFGTDVARLDDITAGCHLGSSENESVPTMAGVVTVLTRDVSMVDSVVRIEDATPTSAVRLLGIQDGSRREATLGSVGLRLARNLVTIDAPSTLAVGVRLSGTYGATAQSTDDVAFIDHNVIHLKQSSANVGVLAFTTAATIAFNSIRVASCTAPECGGAFATGFYLMHVERVDQLKLLANGFSVADTSFGGGDLDAVPFAVEHANGAELGLTALTDNIHGVESPSSGSPLLVRFVEPSDANLVPPQTHAGLDEGGVNALAAGTALGNHAAPPLYCPDAIHGDPAGPQAGRVTHVTTLDVSDLLDIDGEVRALSGTDTGADILGSCP